MGLPVEDRALIDEQTVSRLSLVSGSQILRPSQRFAYRVLDGINTGSLIVTDVLGRSQVFGQPRRGVFSGGSLPSLNAHMIIRDNDFFDRVVSGGALALGETFAEGLWDIMDDKLTDFFGILLQNHLYLRAKENFSYWLRTWLQNLLWNPTSAALGAGKCVGHRYETGNEFFRLVLGPSMSYSCGYELKTGDALQTMQEQKWQRICRKLGMEKGGTLLDIGCGWGAFILFAARHYPSIKATGITLSKEQYIFATERIREEGLSDRVKVELKDYRDITGSYDFITSIEMFEHVRKRHMQAFMQLIRKALKPGGVGLLHTIGLIDEQDAQPDPWIATYVFPGTRLPRLEEMITELQKAGFAIGHVENLKLHYVKTLRYWKNNLDIHSKTISKLGSQFDDRMIRTWNYYFQACEAGFRYSTLQLYQLLFTPGESWNLPMRFDF